MNTSNRNAALKVLVVSDDVNIISKIRTIIHEATIFNHGASIDAAKDFLNSELYDLIFVDLGLGGESKRSLMVATEITSKQYGAQGHVFLILRNVFHREIANKLVGIPQSGQIEILPVDCIDNPLASEHTHLRYIYQCLNDAAVRHSGAKGYQYYSDDNKGVKIPHDRFSDVNLAVATILLLLFGWLLIPDYLLGRFQLGGLTSLALSSIPALILVILFRSDLVDKLSPFYSFNSASKSKS